GSSCLDVCCDAVFGRRGRRCLDVCRDFVFSRRGSSCLDVCCDLVFARRGRSCLDVCCDVVLGRRGCSCVCCDVAFARGDYSCTCCDIVFARRRCSCICRDLFFARRGYSRDLLFARLGCHDVCRVGVGMCGCGLGAWGVGGLGGQRRCKERQDSHASIGTEEGKQLIGSRGAEGTLRRAATILSAHGRAETLALAAAVFSFDPLCSSGVARCCASQPV
ncbi:hypothetical protein P280DRAFT_234052, partial [Massarina eburnea CBS 473.64]